MTDIDELVERCIDGVIENNTMNGGDFSDWRDGRHIADTYLDGNVLWCRNGDARKKIVVGLDKWLSEKISPNHKAA